MSIYNIPNINKLNNLSTNQLLLIISRLYFIVPFFRSFTYIRNFPQNICDYKRPPPHAKKDGGRRTKT